MARRTRTDCVTFDVSLPHPAVAANYRGSWHARHKARQVQRAEARFAAVEACSKANDDMPWEAFSVHYCFRFATRRRRDLDNLIFAMKATLDGVQDAGLIADDAGCVSLTVRREWASSPAEACVRVEVRRERDG